MSDEEKTIENLRKNKGVSFAEADIILNLIEKQQKELNNLKEIEKTHQEENGLLRQELDMQIEHNKELENELDKTTYLLSRCNKRLENIARELTAEIKIGYDYKEIMQEIKNIKENECNATKCQMVKEYYIRKDKIKEKIEEYEEMVRGTFLDTTWYGQNRRDNCYEIIQVLKELLEEK